MVEPYRTASTELELCVDAVVRHLGFFEKAAMAISVVTFFTLMGGLAGWCFWSPVTAGSMACMTGGAGLALVPSVLRRAARLGPRRLTFSEGRLVTAGGRVVSVLDAVAYTMAGRGAFLRIEAHWMGGRRVSMELGPMSTREEATEVLRALRPAPRT